MNPQVTLRIEIGEAQNGAGLTLSGVITEEKEVVEQDDHVEPAVVEHLWNEYGVDIEP